jgi:hypothetical protein
MAWILDDTMEVTVTVNPLEGLADVTNISVSPASAQPGQTVVATVTVKNVGQGADTLMARVGFNDPDTGALIGSYAEASLGSVNVNLSVNANVNLTIPSGYTKSAIHVWAEGYHQGP